MEMDLIHFFLLLSPNAPNDEQCPDYGWDILMWKGAVYGDLERVLPFTIKDDSVLSR